MEWHRWPFVCMHKLKKRRNYLLIGFKGGVMIFNILTICILCIAYFKQKLTYTFSRQWHFICRSRVLLQFGFQIFKFHSVLVYPETKFHKILMSQTTDFHLILMYPTTDYQAFCWPSTVHFNRQLLGSLKWSEIHLWGRS